MWCSFLYTKLLHVWNENKFIKLIYFSSFAHDTTDESFIKIDDVFESLKMSLIFEATAKSENAKE